ncbi:permease [candidate division KSB1 bacterium]|nr:permease [candidate division KSB1 bacterium]RQW01514.1 MAG: hypothetical protein EH222_15180 [candidate division KSB1 bacterium]
MNDFIQTIYHAVLEKLQGTYTLQIIVHFFRLSAAIAPYFLVAVFIQVALNRYIQLRKITLKTGNEVVGIVVAALLGLLSPLPTYAAVPIALSFVRAGVSLSVAMAFAVASPLINPSIFLLTASFLGLRMALLRLLFSFIIAIAGGLLIKPFHFALAMQKNDPAKRETNRSIYAEFYRTTLFLGKYFAVALFISAAVKALLPADYISHVLGRAVGTSLLIAIALGVPFYTCGGAAIPLIDVLMEKGMSDAAAIAFFIAGPATKLETLYIYRSMLGGKILSFYLLLTGIGAYLAGMFMYLFL